MGKFKVGDMVVVNSLSGATTTCSGSFYKNNIDLTIGKTYLVEELTDVGVGGIRDAVYYLKTDTTGKSWWVSESDLSLEEANPTRKKISFTFRVGDANSEEYTKSAEADSIYIEDALAIINALIKDQ